MRAIAEHVAHRRRDCAAPGAKSSRRPALGAGRNGAIAKQAAIMTSGPSPVTKNAGAPTKRSATSCATRNESPTPNEKLDV